MLIRYKNEDQAFSELLIAELSAFNFDSFLESEGRVKAYMPFEKFDEQMFKDYIDNNKFFDNTSYEIKRIGEKNWNELWESNFEPVIIADRCLIKAPFHTLKEKVDYEIIIEPKMSFGTGHHESTVLMVEQMLDMDMTDNIVLDMGCGTGVLAILAYKKGAGNITAIDNFDWAAKNAKENIKINNCRKIKVLHGDASDIRNMTFSLILANINKNVLLQDMHIYYDCLCENGQLLMSGILEKDVDDIVNKAFEVGLKPELQRSRNNWSVLLCNKR